VTHKQIIAVRMSVEQMRVLQKLSVKLNLDRTSLIRLAISRLAEIEGVR
jgi:hypothetical protein